MIIKPGSNTVTIYVNVNGEYRPDLSPTVLFDDKQTLREAFQHEGQHIQKFWDDALAGKA